MYAKHHLVYTKHHLVYADKKKKPKKKLCTRDTI